MRDAVIVGAGLAGLSAAWRLRHWDTVVLDSEHRIGGRIRSEKRGRYFLNWGGHVFAGPGTGTDRLIHESGTRYMRIPGSLSGISMNGKLLVKGRPETYPLRIPMPVKARIALMRSGAKLMKDVSRYAYAVRAKPGESGDIRQQRIYDFENDRTFADYLGDLPEDAESLFRPTVTRSAGDPEELSAGAGIGYFSLVWNIGAGLDRSILGGPSTLTETLGASVRHSIELGAEAQEVVHHKDHVVVRYRQNGRDHEVKARTVVLATPATTTHRIAVDVPADTRDALAQVKYGPYVSAAFLTNETAPQPWDNAYGIATPKQPFSVALNMGNIARALETERQPGGSIMVFAPARLARDLLDKDDPAILERFVNGLSDVLPGFEGLMEEAHIQRWPTGAPYCFPGRAKLQSALTRSSGRVFLAGDYLGSLYTETAITSGFTAAQEAASLLGTEKQSAGPAGSRPLPPTSSQTRYTAVST